MHIIEKRVKVKIIGRIDRSREKTTTTKALLSCCVESNSNSCYTGRFHEEKIELFQFCSNVKWKDKDKHIVNVTCWILCSVQLCACNGKKQTNTLSVPEEGGPGHWRLEITSLESPAARWFRFCAIKHFFFFNIYICFSSVLMLHRVLNLDQEASDLTWSKLCLRVFSWEGLVSSS